MGKSTDKLTNGQSMIFSTEFQRLHLASIVCKRYIMQGNSLHNSSTGNRQMPNPPPLVAQGKAFSNPPPELKVLTLNYCGIMNNPFEFYSQSMGAELAEISQIFDQLVQKYFKFEPGFKFIWEMGKVEQKVRVGRYSPSFELSVGIHESGTRFVTRAEFQERWKKAFDAMISKSGQMFDQKHIQTTLQYDLIYFHTLLRYVYKKGDFEELIKENPKKYKEVLSKFFNQSFLDEKRKLFKVKDTLFKLDFDILFLQQYSPAFEQFIAKEDRFEYATDPSKDTIIVVKKSTFKNIDHGSKVLSAQQMQAMNWSDKTSFLLVDNILLINAHLSSNKEKNPPQMESVKFTLKALKQTQPNLHIILGGDLNAYLISNPEFDKMFHMFPVSKDDITTIKMRTKAQGQYEKGNVPNIESKDKIITDLNIKKDSGLITFIDGKTKPDLKSYIPTDGHPFDHFLVACRVIRQ